MSSFALLLLWVCCTAQQVPVYQEGQMAFDGLVNLLTDPEIPENCGPPPEIENGMLISRDAQQYLSGSVAFYQCYRLYVMEGTPKARCINGQWRSVPRCLRKCNTDDTLVTKCSNR
ncbi:hypothetical protein JRQ81_014562 [Phrynocephalus forsythii]|uniref:Sushi domain-containing protein n=1 Tax=Phrynocephalus forsythii TaxID=171643 RepID=A0A9Q0Y074_9SAUR|nr:hypothetical protein JRQ81_014562 [Phrynocephalus forsythii]